MKHFSIAICYRNREAHLNITVPRLREVFGNDAEIIVVEQNDNKKFRRGNLFNEGAKAASNPVVIFHDVDHYPLDVQYWDGVSDVYLPINQVQFVYNDLTFKPLTEVPGGYRHFKDGVDSNYFGGVEVFVKESFFRINGYNHLYTGWGREDEDLRERIHLHNLKVTRGTGRFYALDHVDSGPSMTDSDFINNISMANNWRNYVQYGVNIQPSTISEITPKHPQVDRWILATDFDGTPESQYIVSSRFNFDEGSE
jgi:glycosyltransferase involved in cell wall biosynthesis